MPAAKEPQTVEADVCVYGGTPGGVMAAVQAGRMGKKTVLVVFGRHVGGMTSGGLTATDVGNAASIGGLAAEFYRRVGKQRGFRPSEAEKAFRDLLKDAGVPVYFERRLKDVSKDGGRITVLRAENGDAFRAAVFVDATYEGDLLAAAGVSFTVGREGDAKYGEKHNGVFFGPATISPSKSIRIRRKAKRTAGCCGGSRQHRRARWGRATRRCRRTTSARG